MRLPVALGKYAADRAAAAAAGWAKATGRPRHRRSRTSKGGRSDDPELEKPFELELEERAETIMRSSDSSPDPICRRCMRTATLIRGRSRAG